MWELGVRNERLWFSDSLRILRLDTFFHSIMEIGLRVRKRMATESIP